MNSYEAKQERKRERYEELATKAENKSDAAYKRSHDLVANIPLGQPILVGHHSERGHRNTLKRSHAAMDRCVAESDKAEYYKQKAASVGTGGISSDDPEAVQKLKEKLAKLEENRAFMKATNKVIHRKPKNQSTPEKLDELQKIGYSNAQAVSLFEPDFCGRIGIAAYQFSNLSGNIRNVKKRIESLESVKDLESFSISFDGGKITVNYEENRVQVFHDEKPGDDIRSELKRNGFRWSRYNVCWQRHINNWALHIAKQICGVEV